MSGPESTPGTDEPALLAEPPAHSGAAVQSLLYVEDNPANLMLVEDLIARRNDIRFLSARDARCGIQIARAALPDMVSHKDAVYNLSRAALATAAFCDGDYSLLGVATKDSLHQKYRLPLIDGGDEMFELAQDLGALAVYISGAGPTIMAVVPRDDQEFFARAQEALPQSEKLKHFTVYRLLPDNTGATVE